MALYRAKATGRDRSVVFEAAMQSAALDRLALRSDLESALEGKQFFLVYQPIFDLDNVRIRGVEALLRWRHPTKGVIVPDGFIPALEDTGLIVPVGRWVLREACRQVAAWRQQGHPITVSVNVSMRQLETDQLVLDVRDALAASGLDAGSLTLEVTESTLMRDAEATVARLRRLKNLGVMIAIDDFGTGYSSMAYLRQFPVDVLKIDRSFVAEVDGSADSAALIHTLVELGRTLGLVTLAEGIEDDVQLDRLRFERCDTGQGFIFSRPVEPSEIEALLTASACSSSGPPVSALSAGRAVGSRRAPVEILKPTSPPGSCPAGRPDGLPPPLRRLFRQAVPAPCRPRRRRPPDGPTPAPPAHRSPGGTGPSRPASGGRRRGRHRTASSPRACAASRSDRA